VQVTRETHLRVAFFVWGLVGTGLLIAGSYFLFGTRSLSILDGAKPKPGLAEGIGLVLALGVGFIKGNLVLKKVARKYSARIQALPETSPIYMTFSPKSWILVAGMMALGKITRSIGAPPLVVGVIYVTVGFALVIGSRTYLDHPQASQA